MVFLYSISFYSFLLKKIMQLLFELYFQATFLWPILTRCTSCFVAFTLFVRSNPSSTKKQSWQIYYAIFKPYLRFIYFFMIKFIILTNNFGEKVHSCRIPLIILFNKLFYYSYINGSHLSYIPLLLNQL